MFLGMRVLELLLDTSLAHSLVPEIKDPLPFFYFWKSLELFHLSKKSPVSCERKSSGRRYLLGLQFRGQGSWEQAGRYI